MSDSVDSLKATIAQLEKELESYKELSKFLVKENAQIKQIVDQYISIIDELFPKRDIVIPE